MQFSSLRTGRTSLKWYKKILQYLLDQSIRNAMILQQTKEGRKVLLETFRLAVIRQIFQKFHIDRPNKKGGRPSSEEIPL
jgi:hypothetical protein